MEEDDPRVTTGGAGDVRDDDGDDGLEEAAPGRPLTADAGEGDAPPVTLPTPLPPLPLAAAASPSAAASPKQRKAKGGTKGVRALPMGSVVKVFVVKAKVNYKLPWQRKAPKNSNGSGFTIHDRRILTNAHVVEDSTTIMVRRHGNPKRYVARVVCIGYQCDIALLEVDDDAFWAGHTPLSFGDVPHLQESVTCVGYPTGGDNISVTCGVVSRVDVHVFVNRYTSLLAVQIDAAINAGNSGGPVFQGNKVVGIAFSRRLKAQNIGHIIPVPVIQRFLTEFEKRGQVTFIDAGITIAKMESPTLRKFYAMNDDHCGVLITQINPLSSLAFCDGEPVLQTEDILMEIDGVGIADDGTISFRGDERIGAEHLFGMKYTGDRCKLKILRCGKVLELETTLKPSTALIPKLHGFDATSSYYIVGGLVFCPLSVPFFHGWYGSSWQAKAPSSLIWHYTHGLPSATPPEEGPEQVVLLAQILASPVTVGYRAGGWCVRLKKFNGVPIRNMKQLVKLVEESISQYKASMNESSPLVPLIEQQPKRVPEAQLVSNAQRDTTQQPQSTDREDLAPAEVKPPNEVKTAAASSYTDSSTPPVAGESLSVNGAFTQAAERAAPDMQQPVESHALEAEPKASDVQTKKAPSFLRFDVGERNYPIVLDTAEVVREEANILSTHFIAHAKSPDLQ